MNDFNKGISQSQVDTRKMLAQFRENNYHEVELPFSNLVIKLRDVGLIDMTLNGSLPNTLMDLVGEFNEGKISEVQLMKDHALEFNELVSLVVLGAVVEPPIQEEGDDDHLGLNELVAGDKLAIFNFVNREAKMVRPFRRGEGKSDISA